ncbi:DUF4260 domain-containing protein [Occallatibacter savannae]|uniref:DUF4260 domain-containing protein n=1 Tax=Occallatibacter savannae TaxID=1002691 RepID=UPI000D69200C|nr:DUF4260 domain-containing protein [Occallatibacter savannae]
MATQVQNLSATGGAVTGSVAILLRLEGLVAAGASAVLYARTGASWWLFAGLWLAPDLSMLAYLKRPCLGARYYNVAHTYLLPGVLALLGWLLHAYALLPIALIWVNHIGVDRLLGYGLKYSDGFGFTHLGRLGKREASTSISAAQS